MISKVWPKVPTRGRLEPAEGEWLHTNGAGAYAMSTVALMHTRRFHGLLVAALDPPLSRHVIVSHAETSVRVGERRYQLATHQFPDVAPTPGYRLLHQFAQDPLPRWTYRLGKYDLERSLCLVRGENSAILSYTWYGKSAVSLTLRPLLPMRPIHDLRSEHGGLIQKVVLRQQEVRMQPVRELPAVVIGHSGTFVGSPDWWRRFEYPEDQRRSAHYQEDLWTPGVLELDLIPGEPTYVSFSVGTERPLEPAARMAEAAEFVRSQDPGTKHSVPVRVLCVAAEQFRATNCAHPATIAGYPWLGVHTRDTLISLQGLYLATGHVQEAISVLRETLQHSQDGFLLGGQLEEDSAHRVISVDATLWLFEAARQLIEHVGYADPFVREELFPRLRDTVMRIASAHGEPCWLSREGLLVARSAKGAATWMDSRLEDGLVTPRHGIAVEIQALWNQGLHILEDVSERLGAGELALKAHGLAVDHAAAFERHFWNRETQFPFDCLSEEDSDCGDGAIRPNALIALDVAPHLFTEEQARRIVYQVRERLLTPFGLRTLEPEDPHYVGYYEGSMDARRAAYHQGVSWPYLLGAYARAALRLWPDDFDLQLELRDRIAGAMSHPRALGQVAQVASGDPPHNLGGCPAQAWSVAELLRTLMLDLHL